MPTHRFNVYGRLIAIAGTRGHWQAFELGADGKRRAADFIVPQDTPADALCEYLADLFHEQATASNGDVFRINGPA